MTAQHDPVVLHGAAQLFARAIHHAEVRRGSRAVPMAFARFASTACATQMAAAGAPLRTLQGWMSHRDYKTTRCYAAFAPDDSQGRDMAERAFGVGDTMAASITQLR